MPFKILFTSIAWGELQSFHKYKQVHIIFVLAKADDFDRQIELAHQNDKLIAYLDERSREIMDNNLQGLSILFHSSAASSPPSQFPTHPIKPTTATN